MPEEEGEVRRAVAPAAELKIHRHEGPVLERHEEVLEVEVAVREDDLAADARRRLARLDVLPAVEERRLVRVPLGHVVPVGRISTSTCTPAKAYQQ